MSRGRRPEGSTATSSHCPTCAISTGGVTPTSPSDGASAPTTSEKLASLDLFLSYWAGPEMAHLIMSFGFDDGQELAWTIEVRREKNGQYSPVADAFKS